jgi:hypothetical protein
MKAFCIRLALPLIAMAIYTAGAYAQCGTAAVAPAAYCPDHFAELHAAAPAGSSLYWYDALAAAAVPFAPGLPSQGNGRHFVSPVRYTAGSGNQTFYYREEFDETAGYRTPTQYPNGGTQDPRLSFTASNTFRLSGFSVLVRTDHLQLGSYQFTVRIMSGGTEVGRATGHYTHLDAVTNGFIAVPVVFDNLVLTKGQSYEISLVPGSASHPIATFNQGISDHSSSAIGALPTATMNGFVNFNVTTLCDAVPESVAETSGPFCCDAPAVPSVLLTSSPGAHSLVPGFVYTDGGNVVLHSGEMSPVLYYGWYKDGVQIAAGLGLIQHTVSDYGTYQLRIAPTLSELDSYSCATISNTITIQEQVLSANISYRKVCSGENVQLQLANSVGPISWSGSGSAYLSSLSSSSPVFSTLNDGVYAVVALADVKIGNSLYKQVLQINIEVEDCLEVEVSANQTICLGLSADIWVKTNGLILGWSPNAGMADPVADKQTVTPATLGIHNYEVEVAYPLSNLVTNGNFEQGNTGFISDYSIGSIQGQYQITSNANLMNNTYFVNKADKTTGSGLMMVVDGGSNKDAVIWATTVDVVAGQVYSFSAWIANIQNRFENPAELSFYADGLLLGQINAGTDDTWLNVYQLYTATATKTITIELKNEVIASGGNDFALDDIVFAPISPNTKKMITRVRVNACTPPAIDHKPELCETVAGSGSASGVNINTWANDIMQNETGFVLEWYMDAALATPVVNTSSRTVNNSSVFYAKVYELSKPGIHSSSKLEFEIHSKPTITIGDHSECEGAADIQLTATPTGGTWSGTGVTAAGVFTPSSKGSHTVSYEYTDANNCENTASKAVTVYENPVAAFAPILPLCINAPTIDVSSYITVTGAAAKNTDSYTSSSPALLTGSVFTPSSDGLFTIGYSYEDANGCPASASTNIIVHPKVVPSFTIPPTRCRLEGSVPLAGTSANPGTGVFSILPSGPSIAGNMFDPNTAMLSTPYTIRYTYTETATQCSGFTENTITVYHANKPIGSGNSVVIPSSPPVPPIPTISAAGANLRWYEPGTKNQIGTGSPFVTGKTSADIGVHLFDVTQTIDGCESEPETVRLEISNCQAKPPISEDVHICEGETPAALVANAQDGGMLGWSTLSEFDDNLTYPSVQVPTITAPGQEVFYVSEWDATNSCWGVSTPVRFEIHKNPLPSITVKDFFCNTDAAATVITGYTSSTNIAANITESFFVNTIAAPKTFDPGTWGEVSGIYPLRLVVEEVIDLSVSKTCRGEITKDIEVEYVAPPAIAVPIVPWLTTQVGSPQVEATGTNIRWHDNNLLIGAASTVNPLTVNRVPSTQSTFLRYATQTSAKGCTSKGSIATVEFIDCNTPAPVLAPEAECSNLPIPPLQATGSVISWYETATSAAPIHLGNTFPHGKTVPGVYTFYASQKLDLTGQGACEGPRASVTLTIHDVPAPVISGDTQLCLGKSVTLTATNSKPGLGSAAWVPAPGLSPAGNAAVYTPGTDGANTISLTWTDANGCKENASFNIEAISVPQPTPTMDDYFLMTGIGQAMPSLRADNFPLGNVIWYENSSEIGRGAVYPAHGKTEADFGDWNFQVRYGRTINTGEECLSLPSVRKLSITDCPVPAPLKVSDSKKCEGDPAPALQVAEGTWMHGAAQGALSYRWYRNGTLISGESAASYTPTETSKATYYYEVSMFDQGQNLGAGCEGPRTTMEFTVNKTEKPVLSTSKQSLCKGDALPELRATGTAIEWFDDANTAVNTGNIYLPTADAEGSNRFYARQTANGCPSELATVQYIVAGLPLVPQVNNAEGCGYPAEVHLLEAIPPAGASIVWRSGSGKTYNGSFLVITPEMHSPLGITKFYAKSVAECQSAEVEAAYTLKPVPEKPLVSASNICVGDENIEPLRAEGENLVWYLGWDNYLLGEWIATGQDTLTPPEEILSKPGENIYYVTQMVNGCISDPSMVDFKIDVTPKPVIYGDTVFCPGMANRQFYKVEPYTAANRYSWEFSGPAELIDYNNTDAAREIYFSKSNTGAYSLIVSEKTELGCTGSAERIIIVSPDPAAYFEYNVSVTDKTISFSNQTEGYTLRDTLWTASQEVEIPMHYTFVWDFARSSSDTLHQWPVGEEIGNPGYYIGQGPNAGNKLVFRQGSYDVVLAARNQFGCRTEFPYRETVVMDIPGAIHIPTAFTPGHASPMLSVFKVYGYNIEKIQIWIFDSWGNTVWYSDELKDGQPAKSWDGRDMNGNTMPADSYIWRVEAEFESGETWQGIDMGKGRYKTRGNVLLIR